MTVELAFSAVGIAITAGGASLAISRATEANTQLFTPLSHLVHKRSLACETSAAARAFQALNYFARPLDRIIQAVAAPIFQLIRYIYSIIEMGEQIETLKNQNNCLKELKKARVQYGLKIAFSPLAIPAVIALGVINSVGLLLRAAIQVVVPGQAILGIKHGKAAARSYFASRKYIIETKAKVLFISEVLKPPGQYQMIDPIKSSLYCFHI